MRASVITAIGGPEVVQPGDVPVPDVMNSDTLVRVKAAGVNPIDGKMRSGKGNMLTDRVPCVIGGEFAGVVVQASYELAPFQPGDEVWGVLLTPRYPGAHAEYVACPFMSMARKPSNLSFIEAGAVPLAVLTAWAAVIDAGRVHTGQRVLIHAGAGGVGHFTVQLAHYYGAHVIATASERNHDLLRDLGADEAVDYSAGPFESALDEPVDVVVDLIGNAKGDRTGSRSLDARVLRDGGTYLCVPTGAFPEMHDEVAEHDRGLVASGIKLSPDGRTLETVTQLFEQGDLRVELERVFPLAEAGAAQAMVDGGHVRGKVVLDIDAERNGGS
ncbi:NADPH:quinone reductase [Pseudoclavibacter endophyticus]|uniref:NADP-dependent oxidoreductase n=2 Tax=Pseudoclavibacter endophyticus TaxID=1778590 RepID=A0A6H9WHC2_9MICO|nr:NADP-dependent oxidoreductase [Pseudoclavibacter endophyticus]GGA69750.1 NADPH:quinone reductase [Pseudoclavibacter endophyticus]